MSYIKLALYACVLAAFGALGYFVYQAGAHSVQVKWDASLHDQDGAALNRATSMQAEEFAQATGFVSLDSTFQRAYNNAESASDPFLSRISSGAYGLRAQWQCAAGEGGPIGHRGRLTNPVPKAAAIAGGRDGAGPGPAQHGGPPVQRVLSIGRDADVREAQQRAMIAYLRGLLLKERGLSQ